MKRTSCLLEAEVGEEEEIPLKKRGKGMLLPLCDECGTHEPRKTRTIRLEAQTWKCNKCEPTSNDVPDSEILLDEVCCGCKGPSTETITLGKFRWLCRDCVCNYASSDDDECDMVVSI